MNADERSALVDSYLSELRSEQDARIPDGTLAKNEWGMVCPRCGGIVSTLVEQMRNARGRPIEPPKFVEAALHCLECNWKRSLLPRVGD